MVSRLSQNRGASEKFDLAITVVFKPAAGTLQVVKDASIAN